MRCNNSRLCKVATLIIHSKVMLTFQSTLIETPLGRRNVQTVAERLATKDEGSRAMDRLKKYMKKIRALSQSLNL